MNRRRQNGTPKLTAGLLAIAVVSAGTYLSFAKDIPFVGRPYEVKAVFSTAANQLQPNAPVRIAGVEVGKVKRLERGPGGTALVTLQLEQAGLPIRSDATAAIKPRLFLEGNYIVDLRPGSPSAPELESGATLPLSQTAVSVQLGQVLAALDRPTRQSLQGFVRELSRSLDAGGARSLRRGIPYWRGAFGGVATTMHDLRGESAGDLNRLITSQARVSGALADRRTELAELVTDFNRTVRALASRRGATAQTIEAAASTVQTARPALRDIDRTLPPLRGFTAAVRPALRRAPATLDAAMPFLTELDRLVQPRVLPGLVADTRPAVREVLRLEPRLVRLFQLVEPVTRCVRDNALPVLNAKVPDGKLSTGQPVWQELRFLVGISSAGANFDANGTHQRFFASAGEGSVSTTNPDVGQIVAATDAPIQGSSPDFIQGRRPPPNRPDVPCDRQGPPSLEGGRKGPPPNQRTAPARTSFDPARYRRLRAALRRARTAGDVRQLIRRNQAALRRKRP